MKIHVTAEDIEAGVQKCSQNCPIARAIERLLDDKRDLWVFASYVCVDGAVIGMPQHASDFVVAFDAGKPVSPIEFDLPLDGINRE